MGRLQSPSHRDRRSGHAASDRQRRDHASQYPSDDHRAAVAQASLAERDRLPAEHLVDKGDTDAQVLLDSQQDDRVTITGPVADDPRWQARTGEGFDKSRFSVDWDRRVVTCPTGKPSISWLRNTYPKNGVVWEARFSRQDCTPCPFRLHRTRAKVEPRIIRLQTREQHECCRRRENSKPPKNSGRGTRRGPVSRAPTSKPSAGVGYIARSIGLAKTHLQHLLTATAVNLVRISEWWNGIPLTHQPAVPALVQYNYCDNYLNLLN
jgi:transposase